MTEPLSPPMPEWVTKRDGRVVPFDADKISRALFAATERLGRPDAFAARELTDGILHFLAAEAEGAALTTAQVGELVVKVVRELGQPAIAQAFAEGARAKGARKPRAGDESIPPAELAATPNSLALLRRLGGAALCEFSLREVFGRDLAAAHRDGLVALGGLEAPLELCGWLLGPPAGGSLVETLEAARAVGGEFLAIDGPEFAMAAGFAPQGAAEYVRELGIGVRAAGVRAVVNLNGAAPPWAGELAEGPLFAAGRAAPAAAAPGSADEIFDLLLGSPAHDRLQIYWHLAERDFAADGGRLGRVVRRALDGAPVTCAFDRPRGPILLAEGIDRRYPAVLMSVGLDLSRLAAQAGVGREPERFLRKLGSLARMALSAGLQKRNFLRRNGRNWPAFLLERARLVVVPLGLARAAAELGGEPVEAGGAGLEFARRALQSLAETLAHDGQACRLDTVFSLCPEASLLTPDRSPESESVLIPWEPGSPLKQQLRSADALRAAGGQGPAALWVDDARPPSADEAVDLLARAWRQTDLAGVRFIRSAPRERQLTAPWEG